MAWTPLGWMDMGEDPDDLHEVVAPGAFRPVSGVPVRLGQDGPVIGTASVDEDGQVSAEVNLTDLPPGTYEGSIGLTVAGHHGQWSMAPGHRIYVPERPPEPEWLRELREDLDED